MLDLMGRGSVIGVNNVLLQEEWYYNAKAASTRQTTILKVKLELI